MVDIVYISVRTYIIMIMSWYASTGSHDDSS